MNKVYCLFLFNPLSSIYFEKYNELSKQREKLWEKCQRTDSKKKESELREQVGKLDKQIDSFYWLDEWKGEY